MNNYKVIFETQNKEPRVPVGATIHQAAEQAGVILSTVCGGAGTCGKCIVKILPEGTDVLACQYTVRGDITVTVPFADRHFEQRKISQQTKLEVDAVPSVCKVFLKDSPAGIDQLKRALENIKPDVQVSVPDAVCDQITKTGTQNGITVVYRIDTGECIEVLSLEESDTTDSLYGVAVDIGTTTVVLKLFNLSDASPLATAAAANPQISRGDDVISRITYASTDEGLKDMHKAIVNCLNSLVDKVCHEAKVDKTAIYEMCVAGNTTMNHLFLQLPVEQLGQAPYKAYSLEARDVNAAEIGLNINTFANVHTIENIAGFVGADTTAAALAVDMDTVEKMTLLVDIGTNGELVLGTKDKLYAASCAAGPALEGARIAQGSRAVAGAIEGVEIGPDDILLEVIGGVDAKSICGSGLIDAMAVLLDLGIVDETGRFLEADELAGKLPEKILARMTTINNAPAFILAENADNDSETVFFTQKDVRETQLAKAAIRAGIIFLQKKIGVTDDQLDQVLLAGAFGNYIDRKSAVRIGLLPRLGLEKVHFVGNAAATGSQMALINSDCRRTAGELVKKIEYIEIANEMEFQMVFAEALMFE
ncbi:MAG: ASKHA domain-containing protein [Phycisphaerae bacterium]|nr:ASKHA domain-containing protein [Phycisphaerae bacterium]